MKDKVSALKICGGQEIKKVARNLPDTAPDEDDDDYKKLIQKLNNRFLPKKKNSMRDTRSANNDKNRDKVS